MDAGVVVATTNSLDATAAGMLEVKPNLRDLALTFQRAFLQVIRTHFSRDA